MGTAGGVAINLPQGHVGRCQLPAAGGGGGPGLSPPPALSRRRSRPAWKHLSATPLLPQGACGVSPARPPRWDRPCFGLFSADTTPSPPPPGLALPVPSRCSRKGCSQLCSVGAPPAPPLPVSAPRCPCAPPTPFPQQGPPRVPSPCAAAPRPAGHPPLSQAPGPGPWGCPSLRALPGLGARLLPAGATRDTQCLVISSAVSPSAWPASIQVRFCVASWACVLPHACCCMSPGGHVCAPPRGWRC